MNTSLKFLIIAMLFLSQSAISQNYKKVNQKALDITISPKDGSVYIVDENRVVSKLNTQTNKFERVSGAQPRTVRSIEIDQSGKLYMVDISGKVHEHLNNNWVKRDGVRTNDIHIDGFGNISVLDLKNNLKRLNYQKKWEDLPQINSGISKPNQVISISSQEYFARGSDNSLKRYWGNKWTNLNGQPLYITVDKKTKIVYAVGRNRGIYKWDMSREKWNLLTNSTKNFETIAVHDGMIWGIDAKNEVYRMFYEIASTYKKVNEKALDITISPKDGTVYIVDENRVISKLNTQTNKFETVSGAQPRTVKSIEADQYGKLYMVDVSGKVHEHLNNNWVKRDGVRTNDIHIDGFGNISVLDLKNNLKRLNYQKKWEDLPQINTGISKPNQVISISSQEYFARGSDNSLKRFWGNKWSNLNGQPLYITVDKKTKIVYAVGRNRGIYKWDMSSEKWNLLTNSTKNFETIAVHDGMVWGIDTKKNVYRKL